MVTNHHHPKVNKNAKDKAIPLNMTINWTKTSTHSWMLNLWGNKCVAENAQIIIIDYRQLS